MGCEKERENERLRELSLSQKGEKKYPSDVRVESLEEGRGACAEGVDVEGSACPEELGARGLPRDGAGSAVLHRYTDVLQRNLVRRVLGVGIDALGGGDWVCSLLLRRSSV